MGRAGAPRTLAVMGDLTFLHDSGGRLVGADEPRPRAEHRRRQRRRGRIFGLLEQGRPRLCRGLRAGTTPVTPTCRRSPARATRHTDGCSRVARCVTCSPAHGPLVIDARVGRADRRATAAADLAADLPLAWPLLRVLCREPHLRRSKRWREGRTSPGPGSAMASGSVASRVLGVVRQSLITLAIGKVWWPTRSRRPTPCRTSFTLLIAGGVLLNSVLIRS